ncbi:MAG: phosphatidate cytidylyltransferase [Opitutales bacterium]
MKQRVLSTLVLWGLAVAILWLLGVHGGWFLLATLALLAQAELYDLLRKIGHPPQKRLGLALGAVLLIAAFYVPAPSAGEAFSIVTGVFGLCVVALSLILLLRKVDRRQAADFMATLFGLVYVPYLFQFYVLMARHYHLEPSANGVAAVAMPLWVILTAKFSDVGGLLVGRVAGRHPFAPHTSPAKTWEGVVGAVIFSVLVGWLAWYVLQPVLGLLPANFVWWEAIVIALPVGIVAIASDLIESLLKRQAGVKDSGRYIPGIGGALDLCDSIILSAPVSYVLLRLFVIDPVV